MDIDDLFDVFDQRSDSENQKDNDDDDTSAEDFLNEVLGDQTVEDEAPRKKTKIDTFEDINLESLSFQRIQLHKVDTVEACLHEVALPPNVQYMPLCSNQGPPAKEYPFSLDPFQREAILCLENDQSVLVSAHTSAGKTVIAEYAVAMSLKSKGRVIYTTPIKALSNQKYREFYEEFKDVGLLTGDATVNATASCLIMTTEILRSMLYRGSDIMREVTWVIFDEIHYMRDKERGVVWEETIILLPDTIHYVFLSATIPNAGQFAQWITHLHHQPCHVVYTDYRPVPLQQYIFPAGGEGLYLVVDENGNFRERIFEQAMDTLQISAGTMAGKGPAQRGRKGGLKNDASCYKIVKMIMERNFAPVIVFSFSKKDCEAYAMQMAKLDFNSEEEKDCVAQIFNSAIDTLSDEDKQLPQVSAVLPLLKKGIGIHHSGLLPILKETIEILFAESLIKALFATETFAMGLNMPARTVLFTNVRKFDGKDFRCLTSGEYIQMSGRAGRRGLDDKGIVILMLDEKMTPSVAKEIVKGLPDPINSAFHLTYNMVLNLLRVDDINPEYMLEKSFYQFQNYAMIPTLTEKLKKLTNESANIFLANEENVKSYYNIKDQLSLLSEEIQQHVVRPENILPFIQPGRMVKINNKIFDFSWGIIIELEQKRSNENPCNFVPIIKVLLNVSKGSFENPNEMIPKPPSEDEKGEMCVIPVGLESIQQISSVRIHFPEDLTSLDNRMRVKNIIQGVLNKFDVVPVLHPITEMCIKDKDLQHLVATKEALEERLKQHVLHDDEELKQLQETYSKKLDIETQIKEVKSQIKTAKSLLQMEELKCRKRVLRRMKFCTSADIIEIKGRVACEISTADELLLTEMIFSGCFEELSIPQMTALLSCFVFQEKSSEMPKLSEELKGPLLTMQNIAKRIVRVSKESKLEMEEDAFVDSFRPHIMDVVYAWTKGSSFATVCKMTDVFEGSIIRCLRHLEEVLRQLCQAAKALGNSEMEKRFSEAIKCIKRDIVFASSLYL